MNTFSNVSSNEYHKLSFLKHYYELIPVATMHELAVNVFTVNYSGKFIFIMPLKGTVAEGT